MTTDGKNIFLVHCRAVLPGSILENAWIRIERGLIAEVGQGSLPASFPGYEVVDASGAIVGPGFVDPHCHGDGETFFFDDPNRVAGSLLRCGTTGVLATIGYPSMRAGGIGEQLAEFERRLEPQTRRLVLGVHLEGPYTNRKYGAQTTRGVIKDFDAAEYHGLLRDHSALIRWWTCAPELPGSAAFIAAARKAGGVVAAGHTEATMEEILEAVDQGLSVITHWTNATGNSVPPRYKGTRRPGIDETALVCDKLTAEIIPDQGGRHVHPLMAKLLYKAKGPELILVITDAGYRSPGDAVSSDLTEERDVCIDSVGELAGSSLDMARAARNFRRFTGCTLPELFRMSSLNAARLLRLDGEMGSIELGKRANLVVLDESFNVRATYLDGQRVFAVPAYR